jgi:hypothetical protein
MCVVARCKEIAAQKIQNVPVPVRTYRYTHVMSTSELEFGANSESDRRRKPWTRATMAKTAFPHILYYTPSAISSSK